jgi:hypothetical protein
MALFMTVLPFVRRRIFPELGRIFPELGRIFPERFFLQGAGGALRVPTRFCGCAGLSGAVCGFPFRNFLNVL